MQKQQQQGFDFVEATKMNFRFLTVGLLVFQRGIIPAVRNRFGVEALSTLAFLAFLLMAVWAYVSGDPLMWGYLAFWAVCVRYRRWEARRCVARGEKIHSLADGWPWAARLVPFVRTDGTAKLRVEPIIVSWLGLGCWWLSHHWHTRPGLGSFLVVAALCSSAVESMKQRIRRRQAQAVLDARLEQEAVMSSYRSKWGNS